MADLAPLLDPSTAIIFEASPLGLGHLRVTDALYHGLPKAAGAVLFGAEAPKSSALYRFASVHRSTRSILEMLQLPPLDQPVAAIGRYLLSHQTHDVYSSLKRILRERFTVPQRLLFVATHAVHAHPMGAIKERLSRELGIKMFLVVQVTDASPQAIWYVPQADLIVVPSEYTKKKLQSYAKKAKLPPVPMLVASYPISPLFAETLSEHMFTQKKEQVNPTAENKIHVSAPVSGAAVGTEDLITYMRTLWQQSDRYFFHVVAREAPFTRDFIAEVADLSYVDLTLSEHERTTIDNYEKVYKENIIALEITKPSEQAFKVLASPQNRGGPVILFTNPVGGQEYDNMRFLYSHGLIPTEHETYALWNHAMDGNDLIDIFSRNAANWRGVLLPKDPVQAARFTQWCLEQKIFSKMMHYKNTEKSIEVQPNGVEQFWNAVAQIVAA